MIQSLMPKSRKEMPDRRVDFRRRVSVAVRKAHDRLFSNLKNPSEQPASDQAQRRREQ